MPAPSEPKLVGQLHEKLAAVVQEAAACPQQAGANRRERRVEVLEVAVITDVHRCAGVQQVGDQEVCVKVFDLGQGAELRVGERGVILGDEAQGQLAVDLTIPLGTNGVVGEDAAGGVANLQGKAGTDSRR